MVELYVRMIRNGMLTIEEFKAKSGVPSSVKKKVLEELKK